VFEPFLVDAAPESVNDDKAASLVTPRLP